MRLSKESKIVHPGKNVWVCLLHLFQRFKVWTAITGVVLMTYWCREVYERYRHLWGSVLDVQGFRVHHKDLHDVCCTSGLLVSLHGQRAGLQPPSGSAYIPVATSTGLRCLKWRWRPMPVATARH